MASSLRLGGVLLVRAAAPSKLTLAAPSSLLRPYTWARVISTQSCLQKAAEAPPVGEDYWDKNKRLNRPLSPHLTIYKPQLTSMLSITHRITGVTLSLAVSTFGIGMLCLPSTFPYYLSLLSQAHYGGAAIMVAKLLLTFPFTFHAFNGIRHLAWDLGHGFTLPALYKSGYGVLALAALSSLALSAY